MEAIFREWLAKELEYDENEKVEDYAIYYPIDGSGHLGKISLEAAMGLDRGRRSMVQVCVSEENYQIRFQDFVDYLRKENIVADKDVLHYITSENYKTIRQKLEGVFTKAGIEGDELYFSCELVMLALKKDFYDYNDFEKRVQDTLSEICMNRIGSFYNYDLEKEIVDLYENNHEERITG